MMKSRRIRWTGHVAHVGDSRNAYSILVGKPEGKISHRTSSYGWEDNIRMALREIV
jgi:hypothetical protein